MSAALWCLFAIIQLLSSSAESYPRSLYAAYQANSNIYPEPAFTGRTLKNNFLTGFTSVAKVTRPRRHEVDKSLFKAMDASTMTMTMMPSTEAMVTPSIVRDPREFARRELTLMIHQLRTALEYLKDHADMASSAIDVHEGTSIQDLVQFIAANAEQIARHKNVKQRVEPIRNVTKALRILLNRIARSAKAAAIVDSGQTHKHGGVDPELMARILQHLAAMKQKQEPNTEMGAVVELSSAELDSGLSSRRPVRQGGNSSRMNEDDMDEKMNAIDATLDDEVEQIGRNSTTERPIDATAKQEDDDSSSSQEEGGGNMVTNLVSSLLGSLSTATGGVDVDAIVTLVGGLSVQRDDGSFDFSGLTELLQSFFGSDEETGAPGSDVGSFLGGLLGATLQGAAMIPGPKGTGKLTGNVVANILPGLSGPPPPGEGEPPLSDDHKHHYDSGSFLAGLLSSMFASSSGGFIAGSSGSGHGGGHRGKGNSSREKGSGSGSHENNLGSADFFINLKHIIFKTLFGLVTSVVGASSQGVSHAAGASSGSSSGHNQHHGH